MLAVGAVNNTLAKFSLFVAAVGWFVLGLLGLGLGLAFPGWVTTLAAVLAAVGTLIGAIVLYVGKEITNTAAIAFVVAALLALLVLLGVLGVFALGTIGTVLAILFAAALIIAGVLFRRPERGSRR